MADVFITPHGKGWAVRAGDSTETELFDSQSQAIAYAREEARARHSYVMLQNDEGELVQHDSYRPLGIPDEETDIPLSAKEPAENK